MTLEKPKKDCGNCPLYEYDKFGFSIPEGTCRNGVLVVGESLGYNERSDALPFRPYAESGSVFQTAIRLLGYEREDFTLYNLINCQPPNNKLEGTTYLYDAVSSCKVHRDRVVNKYKPKVILALGNLALRFLCPELEDLYNKALGNSDKELMKKIGITSVRGYKFESEYGIPIIGSLHPSYIRRTNLTYLGVLVRDIRAAIAISKGEIPQFAPDYNENPTIEDALDFYKECKSNPDLAISYDIETPRTILEIDESELEALNAEADDVRTILSIQFSIRENEGIFFKWEGDFINIARDILVLPNRKIGWNNWQLDTSSISYHLGKDAIKGLNLDVMWLFKWLNSDFGTGKRAPIGRALQFAANFYAPELPAWKHLSNVEPEKYGVIDVDATLRVYNGLIKDLNHKQLRFKYPILEPNSNVRKIDPNSKTLYEGYIDDMIKTRPIYREMSERGVPINKEELDLFTEKLRVELDRAKIELQNLYPFELRRTDPKEGFKNIPKEVTECTNNFNAIFRNPNSDNYTIFSDESVLEFYLQQFIEINTRRKNDKKDESGLILHDFKFGKLTEKRWCRREEFKPNSSQQVKNYLIYKGYKIPKKKTKLEGSKDTTDKDQIHILAEETGDQLLDQIIYVRELIKMLGTYAKGKEWKLDKNNRVHSTYVQIAPTGQTASRRPNLQNVGVRGTRASSPQYIELAKGFRKCIEAQSGKVLLSLDWSSFHIHTMAFESEDETYLRLARLDIHSYVAAYILRDELSFRFNKYILKGKAFVRDNLPELDLHDKTISLLENLDNWIKLSDSDLKERLSWIKSNYKFTRDSQAKVAILALQLGMGINKFFKLNRYSFKTIDQPKKIFKYLKDLFPKVFVDFQSAILKQADEQTYLISRYGYIRKFYNIYDKRLMKNKRNARPNSGERIVVDSKKRWWSIKPGTQASEAISFHIQNDAFGKKKECMRELELKGFNQKYGLINDMHDAFQFETDERLVEEAYTNVKEVMELPAQHLKNKICPNGLICRVSAEIGTNLAEMKPLEI